MNNEQKSILNQYEPKLMNRFIVEFPEFFDIKRWEVSKINKPKFINGDWSNIEIVFNDIILSSSAKVLYELIEIFKNYNPNKSAFEFKIKSNDPVGNIVEEWIIYIQKFVSVDFGELDSQNNDIVQMRLIVKPFKCTLNVIPVV